MKPFVRFLASLLFVTSSSVLAVSPGQPAPDFTLPDLSGKPVRLSELKGKTVVLEWVNPE